MSALSYAQTPIPFLDLPLVPDAVAPGGPDLTLTVNGTGFVSNSVVNWNGGPLVTQFVSGSQLTAIVPAAYIATGSTGWVTVSNPPPGGGTSNAAFFAVTANEGSDAAFTLLPPITFARGPTAMIAGDFDGDGKLDLAVAKEATDTTISILLGDGKGNFTLVSSPDIGSVPESLATGDFNGDGKLDLAVGGFANLSRTVFLLLGDGTGNFALGSSWPTDGFPGSLAVGDFNRDGNLDLAAVTSSPGAVYIFLGDGTGNFTVTSSPAPDEFPTSVGVGDFNRDDNLDLAVANSVNSTVSILLGDGTGNFTPASSSLVDGHHSLVAVGDFNGDGKLDMAVPNSNGAPVSILLGDGSGNFTSAPSPAAGNSSSLTVGDFNGDSKLDIAVPNLIGPFVNTISILLGDGAGRFTLSSSPGVEGSGISLVAGDFNGDGMLDLAIGDYQNKWISVLLNRVGYILSVTNAGSNGAGTVTSDPLGILCGSNCSASFVPDTSVALVASPATGFVFDGWSGACSGRGTCSVKMDGAESVTAMFNQGVKLSVSVIGPGYVSSDPPGVDCFDQCAFYFDPGATVTLTPHPIDVDSYFVGWGGACSGPGACSVTLTDAVSVTATFGYVIGKMDLLSVTEAGNGTGKVTSSPAGIDCPSQCSGSFIDGEMFDLTATADPSSFFAGWSGACSGTSDCPAKLYGADVYVTATFNLLDFTLTAASASMSLQRGGQGTDAITITPQNGSAISAVQLTCSVAGQSPLPTCSLFPASVTPGSHSAGSTLTVTAPQVAAAMATWGYRSWRVGWLYALLLPLILGTSIVGTCKRHPRRLRFSLGVILWLILFQGCGGAGNHGVTTPAKPAEYTVTVTALSGTISHTTKVGVTVR